MDKELSRELASLKGEQKMSELAVKGYQSAIAEQLNNSMGKDMNEVLSGRRQVKFTLLQKIKNSFKKMLWHISLEQ